jgi:hypothetical protein
MAPGRLGSRRPNTALVQRSILDVEAFDDRRGALAADEDRLSGTGVELR